MRKITTKIIIALFTVLFIVSIIPRTLYRIFEDFPEHEIIVSNTFFIGMLITVSLALLLLTLVFNKMIVRRIIELNKATKQIIEGEFDLSLPVKGSDEISKLTENFNLMTSELKSNAYLNKSFVKHFTHEFNTPITAIKGYATMMKDETLTQSEMIAYADIIEKASTQLSELSKSILALNVLDSQVIVAPNAPYLLKDEIQSVINLFSQKALDNHLSFNTDFDTFNVTLNQGIAYPIWKNLIDNAINYAFKDSTIKMDLKDNQDDFIFEITNAGQGIKKNDFENIFQMFYRGDSSQNIPGSGIGLSIVAKSIQKLKGSIDVSSDENSYVTFKVLLPKD